MDCPKQWRQRHDRAVERLRQTGIALADDQAQAAAAYIQLRARWDGHVRVLARYMLDAEESTPCRT